MCRTRSSRFLSRWGAARLVRTVGHGRYLCPRTIWLLGGGLPNGRRFWRSLSVCGESDQRGKDQQSAEKIRRACFVQERQGSAAEEEGQNRRGRSNGEQSDQRSALLVHSCRGREEADQRDSRHVERNEVA